MSLCFPAKDRCDTALEYAINKLQFVGFNCCHAPERPRRFRMQLNPRLGELAMCLTAMAAGVYNLMKLPSHVTSVFKTVSRNWKPLQTEYSVQPVGLQVRLRVSLTIFGT